MFDKMFATFDKIALTLFQAGVLGGLGLVAVSLVAQG